MGYRLNGCSTGGVPMYLIQALLDYTDVPYFIETGTAGGESIREAAKRFKICHTIELIEGRSVIDSDLANVKWHTGNSVNVLPNIINELSGELALFFLDAHYSDPVPNTSGFKECYLLDEIAIISAYKKNAIIFIDDARLFYGPPPAPNDPREWPSIRQIFSLFEKLFPDNVTTIRDDYIISFPERLSIPMDAEWVRRYSIRYPSAEDKIRSQVKDVFEALKNYIDAV